MTAATVVVGTRSHTGEIRDHLGDGYVVIDGHNGRIVGELLEHWQRRNAGPAPTPAGETS